MKNTGELEKELAALRRRPLFGEIYRLYEGELEGILKPVTIRRQQAAYRNYLSRYADRRADRISPLGFQKEIVEPACETGHCATALYLARLAHTVLDFGVAIGVLEENPLRTIWSLPRVKAAEKEARKAVVHRPSFDHSRIRQEAGRLVRDFKKAGGRRWLLLQVSLRTLLRPGEVVRLRWPDLDLKRHQIAALGTKTRAQFVIPTDAKLEAILEEAWKQYGSAERGWIFRGLRDPALPLSPQTLNRALKDLGYKDRLCAHGIRALGKNWFSHNAARVPPFVSEAILQHAPGKVEGAYRRDDDYLMQRRSAMKLWWAFLDELEEK